jgi:hypothetical protein
MLRISTIALLVAIPFTIGCGPSGPVMHKVTGKVTYMDNIVAEGAVVFEDPTTGMADRVELKAEGTYEIKVANGTYRVSVEPLLVEAKSKVEGPPDYQYKKVDNIPQKYRSGVESGLKHTVSGPGTFDIAMTQGKK